MVTWKRLSSKKHIENIKKKFIWLTKRFLETWVYFPQLHRHTILSWLYYRDLTFWIAFKSSIVSIKMQNKKILPLKNELCIQRTHQLLRIQIILPILHTWNILAQEMQLTYSGLHLWQSSNRGAYFVLLYTCPVPIFGNWRPLLLYWQHHSITN